MTEKTRIKCGVVGVGYLGKHHARIYAELEACELVGVYDINDRHAKDVCKHYNCQRFYSYEDLGHACDAVSVVVPTDIHYEVALPLLEMGTHLLVEKPLCTKIEHANEMLLKAKEKNLIIQVGHIENYNPVMSYLEKHINDPRFITADRLAPFKIRGTEVGVVLDLMIHDIGVILQLVKSKVKHIDAIGVNILSKQEDLANARITFENGCVANLNTSRASLKKVREIRIFQPSGYFSLDFMNQKGHFLQKGGLFGIKKKKIPIEKGEPLKLELEHFIECVRKSWEPKVNASLGRDALEIALEITRQIAERSQREAPCDEFRIAKAI